VRHVSRSSGLLFVKADQAMNSQSGLKTGGGVARMVHMSSSWRLRRDQVEDGWVDAMGYVVLCYPCFTVFFLLGPRGTLVFKSFVWAYK
jgi:hypothetical protein